MFDSCKKLTEVTLPESIEVISASAFADCVSLKDIGELPTLKRVETCAFSGCRELTRIYIGSEDTTITAGTYYGCDTLVEVVIPARIKNVEAIAFAYCTRLESVTFEEGAEYIASNAFSGCTKLTSLNLPETLNIISAGAFSGCTKLAKLSVPKGVIYIGENAFESTKWLLNQKNDFVVAGDGVLIKYQGKETAILTIPSTVKRLPAYCIADASTTISTIIIPSNVEYIAKNAFAKKVKTQSSTGEAVTSYRIRYVTICAKKGTYAEAFSNHDYYTFEELK